MLLETNDKQNTQEQHQKVMPENSSSEYKLDISSDLNINHTEATSVVVLRGLGCYRGEESQSSLKLVTRMNFQSGHTNN